MMNELPLLLQFSVGKVPQVARRSTVCSVVVVSGVHLASWQVLSRVSPVETAVEDAHRMGLVVVGGHGAGLAGHPAS